MHSIFADVHGFAQLAPPGTRRFACTCSGARLAADFRGRAAGL
jgi:hypothetical protein